MTANGRADQRGSSAINIKSGIVVYADAADALATVTRG
jgi:hypothetical protein